MLSFLKKFGKVVLGSILVIVGLIGSLIPIPIVPFFLLTFLGLYLLGWDKIIKKWLQKKYPRLYRKLFKN